MKAVDPTIQIGANGDTEAWWRDLLPAAGADIDFLVAHDYPCWEWGRFETYRRAHPGLTPATDIAVRAIGQFAAPADRTRLKVAATEFNAADWSKSAPWPNDNDLGHVLVLAEMIGGYLVNPQVLSALLWNTRWIDNARPVANTLWDTLDHDNRLNASGLVLALWRHAALDRMVAVAGTTDLTRAFASVSADSGQLAVLLVNKADATVTTEITVAGFSFPPDAAAECWTLGGSGPADRRPRLASGPAPTGHGPFRVVLPACSATAVRFSTSAP